MDGLTVARRVVSEIRALGMFKPLSSTDKENYITIMEALEKQIPKKVTHYSGAVFSCPSCPNLMNRKHKYCHHCGQKLEWEET